MFLQLTGSLSDGLWNASMDSKFQESRDAMRAERFSSSKDHFVAGVKGLGMGIVGGLTSIVTQPIEGAHNAGLSVSLPILLVVCCSVIKQFGPKVQYLYVEEDSCYL